MVVRGQTVFTSFSMTWLPSLAKQEVRWPQLYPNCRNKKNVECGDQKANGNLQIIIIIIIISSSSSISSYIKIKPCNKVHKNSYIYICVCVCETIPLRKVPPYCFKILNIFTFVLRTKLI